MNEENKKLNNIRHSLSHLLAIAVLNKYPETKLGIGPTIKDGFYYDFLLPKNVTINDNSLKELEKDIKELIKQNLDFKKEEINEKKAKELFKNQPFKLKLIEEYVKNEQKLSIYNTGNIFTDLCAGNHIKNTEEINPKSFKLTHVAGAYWHGDENNQMLTRIYGTAFESILNLQKYLQIRKEIKKRDHRKIGKDLELFMLNKNIGQGLIIWLPKGAQIRKTIEDYLYKELKEENYKWLYTPHIANRKLWEISGHWDFYSDSMYPPIEIGHSLKDAQNNIKSETKEEYLIKPMNCPFHLQVYNSKIRSYNDLPIKYAELGTVYRYERSGTLHGLTRVRGFTQDDAHIICHPKQMPEELSKLVKHGLKMLNNFGFSNFNIYLSTKPKKYVGSDENWKTATTELENTLKENRIDYKIDEGGGVFYGPKIDIKIKDAIGREWQCTTIQFDFNLPERFDLTFINKKGEKERPFMIHRALLGSMERFVGVLIEHYAGDFPVWLAPIQTVILPINENHQTYTEKISKKLKNININTEIKKADESLGKRIRNSEKEKIPYILVIGDKEKKEGTVNVRKRHQKETETMSVDNFIEKITNEIKNKT